MKIGFIGLGSIGNPMAVNLARAGHALQVRDLDPQRADNLVALGARRVSNPREAATGADVLFTSLPGPPQVRQVLEGPDGAIEGLAPGSLWIDMSTTDLAQTRQFAEKLQSRGVAVLEAPVTGGVANAHAGKLSIFVGGPVEAYERAAPLLRAIGDKVMHLGPIGNASVAKLITNLMCFLHEVALGEGLVLGARLGLDPVQLWEAIKVSYADSFVARVDGPDIFDGNYGASFAIALACKDIGLTLALARKAGLKLEAAELVERLYDEARRRYGETAGCLSAIRTIEEASGVSLPRALPGATPTGA
jgi:3-hydroxyisobutyrate dehydrogenase-like beta-hydroxyacid dehydrogenase